MKYCSKCGNELFDEAVICPKCGCPVPNAEVLPMGKKKGRKGRILGIVLTAFWGFIALFEVAAFLGYATNGENVPIVIGIGLLLALVFVLVGILLIKGIKITAFLKDKKRLALVGLVAIIVLIPIIKFSGSGSSAPKESLEDSLKTQVWADVSIECKFSYADVRLVQTNITNITEDNGIYTIQGKVTITDNYGDKYTGKIDGTYEYYESSNLFHKISLEIEQPKKNR